VATGTLIAESLNLNVALERVPLEVREITRIGPLDHLSPAQPNVWTFIEFSVPDEQASALAEALALVLDQDLGWYCDFRTEHETFVVFGGRIFRYPRGDPSGREAAATHARTVGVPEAQIDWPE
jgi:hypothetical protein